MSDPTSHFLKLTNDQLDCPLPFRVISNLCLAGRRMHDETRREGRIMMAGARYAVN